MRPPPPGDAESADKSGTPPRGLSPEERAALDELYKAAFEELRRLASILKRSRTDPAVSTGTLISTAWIRLASARRFAPESKQHFMNMAATIMRQVLVEAARRRGAIKRGKLIEFVDLETDILPGVATGSDLLALDLALEELAHVHPRQAQIVEKKLFGGFDVSEIAGHLGVAVGTVNRDWRVARAWLAVKVRPQGKAAGA